MIGAMTAWRWPLLAVLVARHAAAQTRVSTAAELVAAADAEAEVIILTDHIFLCDRSEPNVFDDCETPSLGSGTQAIVVRTLPAST